MAKYDRLGLRAKLELKRESIIDAAAQRTAVNEAAFEDYKTKKIEQFRKVILENERFIEETKKLVFGDPLTGKYYDAPKPVTQDEGRLAEIDRALDELDIMIGDEVTLKTTAMLKLL